MLARISISVNREGELKKHNNKRAGKGRDRFELQSANKYRSNNSKNEERTIHRFSGLH